MREHDFGKSRSPLSEDQRIHIASNYLAGVSVVNSCVRLEHATRIFEKLTNNQGIRIAGPERIGKTSMLFAMKEKYGKENSLIINIQEQIYDVMNLNRDEFIKKFCFYDVAWFIARRELNENISKNYNEKTHEVETKILASKKSPLEYLDEYLKGEKIFLGLDEVAYFKDDIERLKYIPEIGKLAAFQTGIVLHRLSAYEDIFQKIFPESEYEPHFINALYPKEVAKIVRLPLGDTISFTDNAIKTIADFTGSRPMEISLVCKALLDPESKNYQDIVKYGVNDVKKLTVTALQQGLLDKVIFSSIIKTYERTYNTMSNGEKNLIQTLAQQNRIPVASVDRTLAQPLVNMTYIYEDDKGFYKVNGTLLQHAILNKFTL